MTDSKPALASKTVWGSLAVIISAIAPLALRKLGVTDSLDQQQLVDLASQALALLGGAVALFGRLTATRTIRS